MSDVVVWTLFVSWLIGHYHGRADGQQHRMALHGPGRGPGVCRALSVLVGSLSARSDLTGCGATRWR
jgi:hypothetical protein